MKLLIKQTRNRFEEIESLYKKIDLLKDEISQLFTIEEVKKWVLRFATTEREIEKEIGVSRCFYDCTYPSGKMDDYKIKGVDENGVADIKVTSWHGSERDVWHITIHIDAKKREEHFQKVIDEMTKVITLEKAHIDAKKEDIQRKEYTKLKEQFDN
jgi:hypothetical protein